MSGTQPYIQRQMLLMHVMKHLALFSGLCRGSRHGRQLIKDKIKK